MCKSFKEINERSMCYVENIQNGFDVDNSFNSLVKAFKPIINKIISRMKHNGCVERDDLEQEATIALWECCQSYNLNSKITFYTYFYGSALNALTLYIHKFQTPITITKYEREKTKDLREFTNEYHKANGCFPTVQDYISFGFDEKTATCFYNYILNVNCPGVLDDNIEILEDDNRTVEESYEEKEKQECLYNAINQLEEQYKQVIELNYIRGMSTADIAKQFNVDERTIRKWRAIALQQLKENLQDY